MNPHIQLFSICAISLCAGCGTAPPSKIVDPAEISVEAALAAVGRGLTQLKDELNAGQLKTGLFVDTMKLDLNLSAQATSSGGVTLTVAKDPTLTIGSSAGNQAVRTSTLSISFKNVISIEKINEKLLKDQKIQIFQVDPN